MVKLNIQNGLKRIYTVYLAVMFICIIVHLSSVLINFDSYKIKVIPPEYRIKLDAEVSREFGIEYHHGTFSPETYLLIGIQKQKYDAICEKYKKYEKIQIRSDKVEELIFNILILFMFAGAPYALYLILKWISQGFIDQK